MGNQDTEAVPGPSAGDVYQDINRRRTIRKQFDRVVARLRALEEVRNCNAGRHKAGEIAIESTLQRSVPRCRACKRVGPADLLHLLEERVGEPPQVTRSIGVNVSELSDVCDGKCWGLWQRSIPPEEKEKLHAQTRGMLASSSAQA